MEAVRQEGLLLLDMARQEAGKAVREGCAVKFVRPRAPFRGHFDFRATPNFYLFPGNEANYVENERLSEERRHQLTT